ncbi:MAG: RnfABCDGE type electron transport complex subunit D [Ruminococcaceae bacterium]|nr:RnfABCDGE type electron transport complex subunit D [Oscillospiraceae bacterium]
MEEKRLYKVTSNPIVRVKRDTRSIMLDVIIALLPAIGMGIWMFGTGAVIVLASSVISCVFFEWAYEKLMKKTNTVGDLSAVVTGLLLTCVLPASSPWWMPVIGAFFAIIVVKQLYGGIGKNFLNPALAGRAFLTAGYAAFMTRWMVPSALAGVVDGTTMATPLASLYGSDALPAYYNLKSMLIGYIPGCIGEISTIAVLLGACYLLIRKVITWRIPLAYLGTFAVLTFALGKEGYDSLNWTLLNLASGGLVLAAFFMATDYSSSPVTPKGQLIYGVGCGLITVLIRYYGGYPEGATYAILIMNTCAWAIDALTRRRQFGVSAADVKEEKAKLAAEKKKAKEGAAS